MVKKAKIGKPIDIVELIGKLNPHPRTNTVYGQDVPSQRFRDWSEGFINGIISLKVDMEQVTDDLEVLANEIKKFYEKIKEHKIE